MKISLKWLKDYIDIQDYFSKPNELAALLTAAGIEVESIENLAKKFDHVVVGHILKKDVHPNADRLSLCQISTGEGVVHQIVCGAQNHKEGDRVVVALPGAVLPGNFAIKHSKIRGVESGGMLCSETELGLKKEAEGILILPPDVPVGQLFSRYMELDDIIFELKVTPNRADCLSHVGLARELACVLGREICLPAVRLEVLPYGGGSATSSAASSVGVSSIFSSASSSLEQIKLDLRATDLCPRYSGRGMTGVKVGPSPEWLRKRLEVVGLNSINNIVDITNYVMHEMGQPLHAFDVRQLRGAQITIDRATAGEKFTTLDGTELAFDGTELTIRDAERAVALAGIVGGKNSGIEDDTNEIFLESAYFTPDCVRRTSRKFGIETDSAYRFARGTNPDAVVMALDRAAQLIQQVAGGQILNGLHDQYPFPVQHGAIEISLATLEGRLGYKVEPTEFISWMKRLGCEIKEIDSLASGPLWSVNFPNYRWDLQLDIDLVEEYARLHGYQHIPEKLPALTDMPAAHDVGYLNEQKIRRFLQAEGCLQAINYAFTSRAFQERLLGDVRLIEATGLRSSATPVALMNPLNEEINVMRTSLVPALVKNLEYNSRQGNPYGRLFEVGHAFFAQNLLDGDQQYTQEARLAFAFWGEKTDLWNKAATTPLVFQLKASIENLLRGLGLSRWKWTQLKSAPQFLHPGQSVMLECNGKTIGFVGTVHPFWCEELKIREVCAVAELNLDRLLVGQPKSPRYQPISRFPAMERDIALLLPKELSAALVDAEIRRAAGDLLKDVSVFDVFEGASVPVGQRSVAFRLVFQSPTTTLDDLAVNALRDKALKAVESKFSVTMRA
jgi:phenylalanyl-tRNA synthetase beta chain